MTEYEIGVKVKPGVKPNADYILNNREIIVHKLICKYLENHPGIQDELTLWTAFKLKRKVRSKRTGEEYYIHIINSYIEWESNTIQTRYTLRKAKNISEFNITDVVICQPNEIECVEET